MSTLTTQPPAVVYPDSDGELMADNTLQFEWIVTLQGNLDLLFRDDPTVFVAGDHLIYPVKGRADIRVAPDVYVAFGRPKGHRGSYKVFEENNVFPQVIFEVWSPGNMATLVNEKLRFYAQYGAEEYYVLYPERPEFWQGWLRQGNSLVAIREMNGFVSPRLGIRFESIRGEIAVYHPNNNPFISYIERSVLAEQEHARAEQQQALAGYERTRADAERARANAEQARAEAERERANAEQATAEAERERAEAEWERANAEQATAEAERERANAEQATAEAERERANAEQATAEVERERANAEYARANVEQARAEVERERAARLAARLRELGVDPDAV